MAELTPAQQAVAAKLASGTTYQELSAAEKKIAVAAAKEGQSLAPAGMTPAQAALARTQAAAQQAQTRIGQIAMTTLGQDTGVLTAEERADLGYMIEAGGFAPVSAGNPWATPTGGTSGGGGGGGGGQAPIVPQTYTSSDGKVWATAEARDSWEIRLAEQELEKTAQKTAQEQANVAARKSAFEVMKSRFDALGLPELGAEIERIYKGTGVDRTGKPIDVIPTTAAGWDIALRSTQSYYDRFGKTNEMRIAAGYRALDEGTIIKLEDEYQKTLKAYSMPTGFYDQAADFQQFIAQDKSVSEVADTVQAFLDYTNNTNPAIRAQLQEFYGIGNADLAAYFMDPNRGQQILTQIASKNLNTAAALQAGLDSQVAALAAAAGATVSDAPGGTTYSAMKAKYGRVAQDIESTGMLGQIYGETYGAAEAVGTEFAQDLAAERKRKRLYGQETAAFSGAAGVGTPSLARRTGGML